MRRGRHVSRRGGDNSYWLSFSDLMSSLVLIIILVMFYIMYQYFVMMDENATTIAAQQAELDTQAATLATQKTELDTRYAELVIAQGLLQTKETELATAQSTVEQQATELGAQQTQLDALSIQLGTQQTQLLEQQAQLEAQAAQIEQLVGLKPKLVVSLSEALRDANIIASVDGNGAITLESDVMFETGKYDLTPEGKAFIDRFLPVYLNVLFSDDYLDYVSEVIIEGHTDSVGTFVQNLELSQRRAGAVASYVLDDRYMGITTTQRTLLRRMITANGRSYSDPVYDEHGREDLTASRRVVFKFRLTDEQMITQLQQILEEQEEQTSEVQLTDTVEEAQPAENEEE